MDGGSGVDERVSRLGTEEHNESSKHDDKSAYPDARNRLRGWREGTLPEAELLMQADLQARQQQHAEREKERARSLMRGGKRRGSGSRGSSSRG